ncbi:hypothetical protein EON67_00235 [archaeon]|nr:MAG: hypothetical protein EON67_00235 [archaeon]
MQMTKHMKEGDAERMKLLKRCVDAETALVRLIEEKTERTTEVASLRAMNARLVGLSRALQQERDAVTARAAASACEAEAIIRTVSPGDAGVGAVLATLLQLFKSLDSTAQSTSTSQPLEVPASTHPTTSTGASVAVSGAPTPLASAAEVHAPVDVAAPSSLSSEAGESHALDASMMQGTPASPPALDSVDVPSSAA